MQRSTSRPVNETASQEAASEPHPTAQEMGAVTIRFAGDSGDGMQIAGVQFTDTSAIFGNDISTLPDYPSEIRAPAGTMAGVSSFQIQFSRWDIYTPGDSVDVLVAMNPAALRSDLHKVKPGGTLLVNDNAFDPIALKKAGYAANPLTDNSLSGFRVVPIPIDVLNSAALKLSGLTAREIDRCKNFFALGVVYWLYDRSLEPTLAFLHRKFGPKSPAIELANATTLKAGYHWGETAELLPNQYRVPPASLPRGTYRRITGNEAIALGLVTAAKLFDKELFYAGYPITPASEVLHQLAGMKQYGVTTFQAEDEISAMGAALGAAFGGSLAATGTSGPGLDLKTEAIGYGVMTELPAVIIDVQRGGPSTGLPTKTEQSDLLQCLFGRHGECPVPVLAAASPSDCFNAAMEAAIIAVRYMTPVLLLSDGYIANSSEPWQIPNPSTMKRLAICHPQSPNSPAGFSPYERNEDGARPWAIPGTPGLEHRLGGLEKSDGPGVVSHDPANHQKMVELRAAKIAGIQPAGAPYLWTGPHQGEVLLLSWGGTYGACKAAALQLSREGLSTSGCHLRYLNPLPQMLGHILTQFQCIVVPELNMGQLSHILQARFCRRVHSIAQVRGEPFHIADLVQRTKAIASEAISKSATPYLQLAAHQPSDKQAQS